MNLIVIKRPCLVAGEPLRNGFEPGCKHEKVGPGGASRLGNPPSLPVAYLRPAAARSVGAMLVFSQVNSGSSRPKWP